MSNQTEIITMPSQAISDMEQAFCSLALSREPKEVIMEAVKAAQALKGIIDQKKNKVIFNGETYVENEDWIMVGRFFGVTARITVDTFVQYGEVRGFEATAEAFLVAENKVIGRANAMCLNDEENWGMRPKYEWVKELDQDGKEIWLKSKEGKPYPKGERKQVGLIPVPLFQLRSMAQTRAISKVLSTIFKWVVVLAGYQPTPAEEVDQRTVDAGYRNQEQSQALNQGVKKPQRKQADTPAAPKDDKPRDPDCITEPQQKMLYAISRQCKLSDNEIKAKLQAEFKDKAGQPLQHSRDMLKADFQKYLKSVDPECKFHTSAAKEDF